MTKKKSPSKKKPKARASLPKTVHNALKKLPGCPGVYEMISSEGDTLYVGKAKNLRKRVQTYFRGSSQSGTRIQKMLELTHDINWTEVSSEVEALVLESNLIKEKRPKFNILLRDDKNFAYFCISVTEDFPRITLTRRIVKDGSIYIGPKTSSSAVRKTMGLLNDIFGFRSTNLFIDEISPGKVKVKNPGNIKYPCLNFHIGKCSAPCIGKISKKEYRENIEKAVKFLRGHTQQVMSDLGSQMQNAAREKQFEKAARIRDLFLAVQTISEKQVFSAPDEFSADVIGVREKFGYAFFHVFQIREGKVVHSETFSLSLQNAAALSDSIFAFLREHAERAADTPKTVILSESVFPAAKRTVWEEFFQMAWGHPMKISLPQKGKRKKLLTLAEKNAESYAMKNSASFIKAREDTGITLKKLQKKLEMKTLPERVECFDISHLGGSDTVASMSVAIDGEVKPSEYRRFQLRTMENGEINDFKSMEEVLIRRLRHIPRQMPLGWKVKRTVAKKDVKKVQKIMRKVKMSAMQEKDIPIVIQGKKDVIGVVILRISKDGTSKVTGIWSKIKDRQDIEYFLLQKIFSISQSKTICIPEAIVVCPENYKLLGWKKEEKAWIYKSAGKRRKSPDSLEKMPALIVIDGGKGQLSCAYKILNQFPFADRVTLCALAKRNEEVYIPQDKNPIAIEKNSPEGKFLQNIRDEAHRFAVNYHKRLHQKSQKKSVLDSIPGIGPQIKKKILREFGSVNGIRLASDSQLVSCVGKNVFELLRKNI